MQIKKGDTVVVIAGKNKFTVDKKGNKTQTTGKVLEAFPAKNKVIVEGVNIQTKHQKQTQKAAAEIKHQEGYIDASNVMLLDPVKNVPTRVSIVTKEDGTKVRVTKKSGSEIK